MQDNITEIRRIIAEQLKIYRTKKGLTTIQVGKLVGKSDRTVSAWENGRGQPDAEMFLKLCKLYAVENIEVFFGKEIRHSDLTNIENEIIDYFRELNEDGKVNVVEYIHTLIASGKYKKHVTHVQESPDFVYTVDPELKAARPMGAIDWNKDDED